MPIEHVDGENKGKIMLYALSTCGWCRKTKQLLESKGLEYFYIYMDLAEGEEKKKNLKDLEKWNPKFSYPTIVINDSKSIVGYKPEEIIEALNI